MNPSLFHPSLRVPISLMVLTYNEEENITRCLDSACDWIGEIIIVDSHSTDKTLEICSRYTDKIYQHPFENQARQFNWALDHVPIAHEWVMRLDADEQVTPGLAEEIVRVLPTLPQDVTGIYLKRRVHFMGRWIKHGDFYPMWFLRIFRKEMARYEELTEEHIVLSGGQTIRLTHDFIDENRKGLSFWVDKHNHWAIGEMVDTMSLVGDGQLPARTIQPRLFGSQECRRRWLKRHLYARLPLFVRAFFYFVYRYIIRLGFLDGKEGLIFHFLQGCWYRFLVDSKIYEAKKFGMDQAQLKLEYSVRTAKSDLSLTSPVRKEPSLKSDLSLTSRMKIPSLKIEFSQSDRQEIARRIDRALASGQLAQGENVREFEEAFANYVGSRHAVAVNSGGAAIEIAMRLLDVRDREVLVPTNTFMATATGVLLAGGRIRLVDADPATFSVSLHTLEAAVTPQTVGVMIVHIGGIITPEMEAIRAWCQGRGLWLVEDAAHAHGSSLNGVMAGRFGVAAAFSFFATKVITSGEGGMIVTDRDDLAERARRLRDYGKQDPWVSLHTELGSNWRMSEVCAAIGVVHLRRLDEFIAGRERMARLYTQWLKDIPGVEPVLPKDRSSWYKYIVLLPKGVDRDHVKTEMVSRGVTLSGGVYERPLHGQPVLQGIAGRFPIADDICSRHICLPLYVGMTEEETKYVVESLQSVLMEEGIRV